MAKLSIIYPTARHNKVMQQYEEWSKTFKNPDNVEWIIIVDDICQWVFVFDQTWDIPNIQVYLNETRPDCVTATNLGCSKATGDYMFFFSDDIKPMTKRLDQRILTKFKKVKKPGVLAIDDNFRTNTQIIHHPIINREWYEFFGYMWHPEFESMFCDNWLAYEAHQYGFVIPAMDLKIDHQHRMRGMVEVDDAMKRHEDPSRYNRGEAIMLMLMSTFSKKCV